MKILIKSVEEIEKTLDHHDEKDGVFYDKSGMSRYSGNILDTKGEKSKQGYHRASDWTWHPDWIHVLPEGYDYEEFDSFEEACVWVANKEAILSRVGNIVKDVSILPVSDVLTDWKSWHKAIPVKPKTLQIVRYVNVYENGDCGVFNKTKEESDKYVDERKNRIDCKRIELNYEFKDGKWVERD